jgi:DNA-binding transcriptional LysR family regulator
LTDNPQSRTLIVEKKLTVEGDMETFNAIPVFVVVVEAGGFSAAARKLGLSKSAVSKRITQLENQLGVRLLHRTTRRLSLTEAGERYFEHAYQALASASEAEDAVTQLQTKPKGRLRVSALMAFGRLHIAPLIPEFLQRYPDIKIELILDDRTVDLVEGGFDVAIRGSDRVGSTIIARSLAPLRSILCASPQYIEQHGLPRQPIDLLQHNCLLYSYSTTEWTFIKEGESQVIEVSGNYQVNNSEALREALLQGLGVARTATFLVGDDLKSGRLVNMLEEYKMPSKTLYALFPERRHLPAKVRVFVDFIVEKISGPLPYWDQQD